MNKGLVGKISLISLSLLAIIVFLVLVLPAFAATPTAFTSVSPTLDNNSNSTQTFLYVNFTISGALLDTCLLQLGNASTYLTNLTMTKGGNGSSWFCYLNNTGQPEYNINYTVFANDTSNSQNKSGTYFTRLDRTIPVLNTTVPVNGTYIKGTATQTFSVKAYDSGSGVKNGTVYYWNETAGSPSSSALSSCTGASPTCTVNVDLSNTSTYPHGTTVKYYFEAYDYADTTNPGINGTSTSPWVVTVDRIAPAWSINVTNVTNASIYSAGKVYQFNVTWTDSGSTVDEVLIEFNGANYSYKTSQITKSGNVYSYVNSSLAAGSYNWKAFANDSANNWNSTDTWGYNVTKADNPVTLTINTSTNANFTTAYSNGTNTTCIATAGTAALWKGGTDVSDGQAGDANDTVTVWGANTTGWDFLCNATGNANYTNNATGLTYYLMINKKDPTAGMSIKLNASATDQERVYPNVSNATGAETNTGDGSCTYGLYRNGAAVGATEENILLGVGNYTYVYNTSGCANYTTGSATRTLNITKGATAMTFSVDGDSSTLIFNRERNTSATNLTAVSNLTGSTVNITRNGVQLNATTSPVEYQMLQNITIGNYTLNASYTGNENYSASSAVRYIYINDTVVPQVNFGTGTPANNTNTTSGSVTFNVSHTELYPNVLILYIDGVANVTITSNATYYGAGVNETVLSKTLGEGVHTYYYWVNDTNGNVNYTGTRIITIDSTIPVLNTTVPVNGTYIKGTATQTFSVKAYDSGSGVKNGTVYYINQSGIGSYSSSALSSCTGASPTCTVNVDLSSTSTYPHGTTVKYYFTAYDYADTTNPGLNGSISSPWVVTVDRNAPTYANNATNATAIKVGGVVLISTNWTDDYTLDYAVLETNETGSAANKTTYGSPYNINYTSGQTWSNFTWQNASVVAGKVIQWKIFANDSAGNENVTATGIFTVDGTAPTWVGNNSSNPTAYDGSTKSLFNITWSDNIEVDKVFIEGNWSGSPTNYTMTNATFGGGTYNYTSILPAGTYYWKIYANDTSNNWNTSSTWTFTINKVSNAVNLYLNGTQGNVTYTYPQAVNATGTIAVGTATLWRDGTSAGGSVQNILLGNGTYAYLINGTGNQNYSDNATGLTFYAIVDKGTVTLNLTLNGTDANKTYTYPQAVNATVTKTSTINNEGNLSLWRNGAIVNSTTSGDIVSQVILLANGTYNYTATFTSGNYSVSNITDNRFAVVNKGTPTIQLTVSPAWGVVYPTITNVTCTAIQSEVSVNLYRNDTSVSNPDLQSGLALGVYNYTCNSSATANYTAYMNSSYMTITAATSAIEGYIMLTNTTSGINFATVSIGSGNLNRTTTDSNGYYKFSSISAGTYTVTAEKDGYYANSSSGVSVSSYQTTQKNLTLTGPESYNLTRPEQGFWYSGWHTFPLSYQILQTLSSALGSNYTTAQVTQSIYGNYTILYSYNGSAWTSFVPGAAQNDLTTFNVVGDPNYYILMNATDRIEIAPKY